MRLLLLLVFLALPVVCIAADGDDKVIKVDKDDKEMLSAFDKARKSIDKVIAMITSGKLSKYHIKIQVKDDNGVEYFWLSDVKLNGDTFTGKIDNDPEIVKNVKNGDEKSISKLEIYDWMYTKDKKIYGNYTLRVLLKKMDKDEAAKYKAMLAPE